jgi:hypothetical protein
LNDAFGFGAVMEAAIPFGTRRSGFGEKVLFAEKLSQSDAAQATAKTPKEFAAIKSVS